MAPIVESDCIEVLKAKFGNDDFQLVDFKVVPVKGILGFQGSYDHLFIKVLVNGVTEEIRLFVKNVIRGETVNDRYFDKSKVIFKEFYFFTKIFKDFRKYFPVRIAAECYYADLEKFMIMEDLCLEGYTGMKRPTIDLEHAFVAIEAFANFHAASFIFEEKSKCSIPEKYSEIMIETLFYLCPDNETFLYAMLQSSKGVCEKHIKNVDVENLNFIEEKMRQRMCELVEPSKQYKNILCQGDPWLNNMLFKYEGDKPISTALLDFQCARFAPPALEIESFLHVAMSKEFKEAHQAELKDHYYKTLTQILSKYDVDIAKVLPLDEFKESCETYKEFGMIARIIYMYIINLPDDIIKTVQGSESDYLAFMIEGNPKFGIEAAAKSKPYLDAIWGAMSDAIEFYKPDFQKK